ncbi:hypothetical protein BP5796_12676 [Coleophoma crateriformis]|uniref:Uncharacterized protein n=1 Tax=Coleophoma crateriformis TaxID=565419 RepID=A0A3D8Q5X5_9HELO|nr:hypothetical protein BP5796_12676 [Coleophoma crateriformis]
MVTSRASPTGGDPAAEVQLSAGASLVSQPSAPDPLTEIEADSSGSNSDTESVRSIVDSAFSASGENSGDGTSSVKSHIFKYQYENGRRYHAYREGQYLQPNDEKEQERLDMVHHWYRLTLRGALFRAPILKYPQKVLDIGTGTGKLSLLRLIDKTLLMVIGIWAIEFGDEFPSADVIGTDLSAIQPVWVPPNVQFIIDDAELEWTYADNSFDFIHARTLGGSIKDFPRLLKQAYRTLKPGGWIEFDEFESWLKSDDGTLKDDSAISEWQTLMDQASTKFGRRLNIAETIEPMLKAAGFVDVVDDIYKNPMNPWPRDRRLKELGAWGNLAMVEGIEAISLALFTRVLEWDRAAVEVILARVRKELSNREIHSYAAT